VEADASSASYFIALGAMAGLDAPVRIEGVGLDSIQGDIRFVEAARAMGAVVREARRTAGSATRSLAAARPDNGLQPHPRRSNDAGRDGPVCRRHVDLTNIASWRVKETDRIAAMASELRKLGAVVDEGSDCIAVTPPSALATGSIHTYDDHRIAMCLSLAAFNPARLSVRILDPRCVAKTFPDYFEALFFVARADAADIPVIAIDGPTASGKGTLAAHVAARLGWHQLDSGLLYRATALAALRRGIPGDAEPQLAGVASQLQLRFDGERVLLDGADVSTDLRMEAVGAMASRIAALPLVRSALNALQLSFRQLPGLVADGRDMGTVIFPGAALKVFLTAGAATRAERRYKQLISKGISANIDALRADLEARDERDRNRQVAPLKPAEDALQLDNSGLSVEQSVDQVLAWWAQRNPLG
jgi:3-phosphoshikimate 1-carboxyvinyltransferase